jgi:ankyrin repeat protein
VRALCEDRRLQANIESKPTGVTAVQMAAEMGHAQIVKILGGKPDVEITWALHGAAKKGHHDMVKEFLNSGKEVHVNALKHEILDDAQHRSSFGEDLNPLHLASIYGHASVVRALCEDRRLQANIESKPTGVTAVQMAAEMGHAEIVKILGERLDVEITWALHGAAKKGHHHMVKELLNSEKEVHVNALKQEILDDTRHRSSFGEELNPLHLASIYGHANVVRALCEDRKRRFQANIESKPTRVTALQMAAEMGHTEIVKILVERREVEISWALHGATKKGHREVVEELLNSEKQVHVNALKHEILDDAQHRSSFGKDLNPLHLASIYGHANVVRTLCEDRKRRLQANIESKPTGVTAVQMAAEMGHAEIVKILVERPEVEISWALHGAAKKGHREVVEELLNSEKEVHVNALKQEIVDDAQHGSSFGEEFNPLHLASIYGHVSVVRALCEDKRLQANIESKPTGVTAVQMAAEMGHAEIVKILVERPEVEISWALHGAAKKGHCEVVEKLLNSEKEVHVNALKQKILDDAQHRSSFGEDLNPLHLASIYGHPNVVRALCEDRRLQANIESKPTGVTAVQMAAEMGHAQIVKILGEKPDVEITWALHGAAKKGHHDMVKELLNSGKEVHVNALKQEILDDARHRSSFGEELNPLHLASIYGHANVVQALCEDRRLQANIESKPTGMTAVQMAAEMGHVEIVKILVKRPDVEIALALYGAVKKEHHDVVEELVKMVLEGPEVETRRAFCKAVKLGHHDVVKKLLESGKKMDVNKVEQETLDDEQDRKSFGEKFNPLHLASIYHHVEVVKVLCEQKTLRANTESGAGMTAVQIAMKGGYVEIEKILLDRTDVQQHLDRLYRDRQLHVDAANAILVGATLIASVTFAAWLQPPLGYSEFYGSTSIDVGAPLPSGMYPSFVSVAGHPILDIFWIFNSMSFLFAIATLMVGANAARPPRQDKYIGEVVRTLRTLLSLAYSLLTVSVGCVLGAFACAGFVVLPPVRRYTVTMGTTLSIGLVVVFLSWGSSWISSKMLYNLKIIKELFATILDRLAP